MIIDSFKLLVMGLFVSYWAVSVDSFVEAGVLEVIDTTRRCFEINQVIKLIITFIRRYQLIGQP